MILPSLSLLALGSVLLLFSGCIWHGKKQSYFVHPLASLTTGDGVSGYHELNGVLLTLEGGRQFGLTLGCTSILTVAPKEWSDQGTCDSLPTTRCLDSIDVASHQTTKRKFPFFTVGTMDSEPVFFYRKSIGVSMLLGFEVTGIFVGWMQRLSFLPKDDTVYILHFNAANRSQTILLRKEVTQ
ncbi:MAG: hypothetical protein JJU11_03250 [Candidatus Sumerlaeia bacterium]|nr:hypothetical protein [Candidatus Sumerlaeia bacterium]